MPFHLNFKLPTSKKEVLLKEMSLEQFRILNKYILNNNNLAIQNYFNTILFENLHDKEDFYLFNNFDKFCSLLMLRCVCISPDIEVSESSKTTIKISLTDFLSKCLDFSATFSKEVTVDNIALKLSLPRNFLFENFVNLLDFLVNSVTIDKEEILLNKLPEEEASGIISSLPATVFNVIQDFFNSVNESFTNLNLTLPTLKEVIKFNPFDASFLEMLKILFKTNLANLYEMQYILTSKLNYTPEYLDKNTYTENLIIIKIYEAELKRQEELSKNKTPQSI